MDGQSGIPPEVRLHGDWYNQFEFNRNFGYTFDCMALVDFETLDQRFVNVMETEAGSLVLRPVLNSTGEKKPAHGWLVQREDDGGYYARILAAGSGAFQPEDSGSVVLTLGF